MLEDAIRAVRTAIGGDAPDPDIDTRLLLTLFDGLAETAREALADEGSKSDQRQSSLEDRIVARVLRWRREWQAIPDGGDAGTHAIETLSDLWMDVTSVDDGHVASVLDGVRTAPTEASSER